MRGSSEIAVAQRISVTRLCEAFLAVLAQRLEQSIPFDAAWTGLRNHHGLVDEAREQIEDPAAGGVICCTDPLGCVQRPAAYEH